MNELGAKFEGKKVTAALGLRRSDLSNWSNALGYLPPRDRRPVGIEFALRTYALARLIDQGLTGAQAAFAAEQLTPHLERAARGEDGPRFVTIGASGNITPVPPRAGKDIDIVG